MQKSAFRFWGLLLSSVLFLVACQVGSEAPSWRSEVLAPIAQARLEATAAIPDSNFEADSRNVLRLVYRDTLNAGYLGEEYQLPDTSIDLSFALDNLTLDSDTITERRTLDDLAIELTNSGDLQAQILGQILLSADGDTLFGIPPLGDLAFGAVPVDASEFFEVAELKSGTLTLEIVNEFPVNIERLAFRILNASSPDEPIIQDTFLNILPKSVRTESYDLAGKTVEGNLIAELNEASLGAGDTLPVDLDGQYIELRLIAEDMQASFARATFPDQDLIDTVRQTFYQLEDGLEELQITKLVVRRGRIEANALSTIQDSVMFEYRLEGATDAQGQVPVVSLKMPPAQPGMLSRRSEVFDLEGFTLDLSDGGTTWNTLRERIIVRLLSSGNVITLSEEDSVNIFFGLLDLEPVYLEGYLGQQKLTVSGREQLDIFKNINLNRVRFADAEANIVLGNTLGVPAQVELKDFSAINSRTGETVKLVSAPLLTGPLDLAHPSLPDTHLVATTALNFNPDNSNVTRFISVLPDKVSYDISLVTNPMGFQGKRDNFIKDSSTLEAYLDLALPLTGVLDRLILVDTIALNWEDIELPDQIGGGTLNLLLDNEFAIEANANAQLLDRDFQLLGTLAENFLVQAAPLGNDGRTTGALRSVLQKDLTQEEASTWTEEGQFLVIRLEIDTQPENQPVSIYADYGIDVKLTAQFEVSVQ